MHELTLLASIMKKIEQVAAAHAASKVTGVKVQIGALAHISAEHLREHFRDAIRNTVAQDAAITITENTDTNDPRAQDILLLSVDVE